MNTAYFVDTENVGTAWIRENITYDSNDEIFVVKNATSLALSQELTEFVSAKINYITVETGHNSADILISGLIGSMLDKYDSFVIISNDKGYASFIKYFQEIYGCKVRRIGIQEGLTNIGRIKKKVKGSLLEQEQKEYVLLLVEKYQYCKYIKQKMYCKLCKKYGKERGAEIYSAVKRCI
jgi:hypothetical protein